MTQNITELQEKKELQEKITELINQNEIKKVITEDNLEKFNCAGVWALFGRHIDNKDNKDDEFVCLQVASTTNIKEEIEKDMKLLKKDLVEAYEEFEYVNQFKETLFKYKSLPNRRQYLYSGYLRNNFKDFIFVQVEVEGNEKDKKCRDKTEKEFAKEYKAVCWRNGRPYIHGDKIDFNNRKQIFE